MHKNERGMSFWPFVVTLILLLMFVFMWFSAKSDTDDAVKAKVKAETDFKTKTDATTALELYIERLSKVVGWQDQKTPIEVKDEKGTTVLYKYEKPVPNIEAIEKALSAETEGSPVKAIKDAATVKVTSPAFKPSKGVQVPPAQFKKLPANLKAKVDEVLQLKPGPYPVKPDDQGDAAAVAKYEADRKAWEDQFKKYSEALEKITKEPGYEDYNAVLGDVALYDADKAGVIDWSFWERPASSYASLEEFAGIPAPIIRNIRDSYIDRVKNDVTQVDSLTAALAEKDKVIDNADEAKPGLKQQLDKEQQKHSADVAQLQAEAQTARDQAEKARVAVTGAETSLAAAKEAAKTEAAKMQQTISAQKNALAGNKERYNLAVQRDEPDGALLSADPALGIAYVNLGSQDQLSVGTKFSVWVIGRGGQKVPKGEVVITKVLDSHYSQARIASTALGERPLSPGDMLSNPFYDKRKPIHVFLAGDLKKYPKQIAVARLSEMGAVVDKDVNDKTDWIVLPDSVTAGAAPAAAPEAGAAPADATAPKEESPMARYERLARTFGATLMTERVLEAFLDY